MRQDRTLAVMVTRGLTAAAVAGVVLAVACAAPIARAAQPGPASTKGLVPGEAAPNAVDPVDPGEGGGGGGGTSTTVPTFFEQGVLMRSGETIQPLGPNLMGDTLNEFSGSLSFRHTDVSLPGNNALRVEVGRHLAAGTRQAAAGTTLFGDWDLEIPRLHTIAFADKPDWYGGNGFGTYNQNRCSQLVQPPRSTYQAGTWPSGKIVGIPSASWWSGYQLYVPGVGEQTLFKRNAANSYANPIQPSDGGTYPILTKDHWQLSCLPVMARGAGEGFVARAPDGTRYRFDHMVQRAYPAMDTYRYGMVPRIEIWILPTQITDRFGNWVRFTYGGTDGWRVTAITSSDGRSITFTYSGWGNRIASVNDGSRTWSYGYDAAGALQTVTQPDGSQWRFALTALELNPFSIEDPGCGNSVNPYRSWDTNTYVGTVTHPSGATGSFSLRLTRHKRDNVPGTEEACWGPYYDANGVSRANMVTRNSASYSLTTKTLSGPGMPAMTWNYAYSSGWGSFAPCNCNGTKTVTVTDPQSHVFQRTYGTMFDDNEGLLLSSSEGDGVNVLRTSSHSYRAANAGPYPPLVGYEGGVLSGMSAAYRPLSQRTITQQGVTFTQTINAFDLYARATGLTRSNSLGTSRSETTTYHDHTALWVLGQVSSRTIAGVQAESTSFNASTALPESSSRFGKLQATYGFNADGTLASVTDGLNRSTTLTNYKRGLPQNIGYPDGTGISALVNNIGTIASVTNEAGSTSTWRYGYDAMGRLASKTPPAGDAVTYNPTTLSFVQVPVAEVGLEANHWRQTITTGNAVTINYFDARWRKRLTTTYDAANPGATQRSQRFDYDPYNRTTFAAYPARSIASIATVTPGTATSYDALGRLTQSVADSELGLLTTSVQYLSGFQKRVTDPRGLFTTTAYQIFDAPSESAIASIAAPEGLNVTIGRDVFGKPLAITRSGTYAGAPVSATRSYVYDVNQQLCKTIEPEIGATIQQFDAANNVAWRATGLGLTSTSTCDWASVPAASIVGYAYDARNRVTGTGFGDGSPSIGRSYTADGLPLTVVSNGSTWTYGYNNRRLLTSESLAYGPTYNIGRSYDANAHLSQLSYPNGAAVAYAPNALGEATQVGAYASAVSYHPNGAVAGYTLGNGIAHTLSQNTRGLPLVNRDAGILQDQYSYDANGNIGAIADQQEGVSTRSLGYDGLDRLTVANAPGVWGAASYSYDVLGNLRSSVVGSRNSTHNYGTNNLLATIATNGVFTGYAYDPRGNVTGRGSQGYYFDLGNRLVTANTVASYTYDGWGRRISVAGSNGLYRVQVYSNAGQLLYSHSQQGLSSWLTRYIYLGGKLIAETDSSAGTSYAHTDALGSPVARSNAAGQLISRTRYEPYGATAAGSNPGGNGFTGIGFTGHVNDAETGLVYMQQRYYDPVAGRFLSVDPVTTDAKTGRSFNRYAYAENNPYKFKDPDGRDVMFAIPHDAGSGGGTGVTLGDVAGAASGQVAAALQHVGAPALASGTALVAGAGVGSKAASPGSKPLLGQNPRDGGSRTNTDVQGDRATAKSIFRHETKGQTVTQQPTKDGQGLLRQSEDGTKIRMNADGTTRVDLPGRGPLPNGETIHIPPKEK